MLRKRFSQLMAFVLVSAVGYSAFGQVSRSPFTSLGLGDLVDTNLAHNQGHGLGISNGSLWDLNNVNPALLPYNSLTNFSTGFMGAHNTTSNGSINETSIGGNINYLAAAFPVVAGKLTTSFGLMPYSNVDYDFTFFDVVNGSDEEVNIRENGSGGLNQFYWSNGYAINTKLFIGLKATYLFSALEKEFSSLLVEAGDNDIPLVRDRISASDFLFTGGLAYNIDSIFNSPVKVKFGLTYDFAKDVNAKRLTTFERLDGFRGSNSVIDIDTIISNRRGTLNIPQAVGLGMSFNRGIKWMAGIDVKLQKWSDFKDFTGSNSELDDSFKVTIGGEYTIDPTSVTSYFKRIIFRAGASFEETPYMVENNGQFNQVRDFGINFGWTLPVSKLSSVDMAFRFGKRGNASETILEENYYRIYLGISFNDRWFVKRRYD